MGGPDRVQVGPPAARELAQFKIEASGVEAPDNVSQTPPGTSRRTPSAAADRRPNVEATVALGETRDARLPSGQVLPLRADHHVVRGASPPGSRGTTAATGRSFPIRGDGSCRRGVETEKRTWRS